MSPPGSALSRATSPSRSPRTSRASQRRAGEAAAQDVDTLSRYGDAKRLALVACLLHTARMRARDDLAEMCKRVAANLKRAKAEPEDIRVRRREVSERLVGTYRGVLEHLDPHVAGGAGAEPAARRAGRGYSPPPPSPPSPPPAPLRFLEGMLMESTVLVSLTSSGRAVTAPTPRARSSRWRVLRDKPRSSFSSASSTRSNRSSVRSSKGIRSPVAALSRLTNMARTATSG
ncbi:hypothetical protein GCM10027294_23630 [Marinactinospora endophytica]